MTPQEEIAELRERVANLEVAAGKQIGWLRVLAQQDSLLSILLPIAGQIDDDEVRTTIASLISRTRNNYETLSAFFDEEQEAADYE